MKPNKQKEPEGMVLYRCPYCGEMNLKSLIEIKNNDTWCCAFCGHTMKPAG
jgi:DNA-directed RNA polymerase subunit RPC12/RpoP